jgi:hypothetical protein
MMEVFVFIHAMQERLHKGNLFVNENFGAYKNIEELWDGEQ